MTAGLPGAHHPGSTLYRRTLAAIVAMSIVAVPAHAQGGVFLVLDTTPRSTELNVAIEAPERSGDVLADAEPDADAPTPQQEPALIVSPELSPVDQPPVPAIDQVIYKGVVGNILEAVPLDPEQRVHLQRGNAVLNNTFTGRSLALLLGIASPPLMIVGLIWGIWSAANIKPAQGEAATAGAPAPQPQAEAQQVAAPVQPSNAPSTEAAASESAHVAAQGGE
jgi:hypothetical protein